MKRLLFNRLYKKYSQYLGRKVCHFTFPLNQFGHNDGHQEFYNCQQQALATIYSGKMLQSQGVLSRIPVTLCQ